MSAESQCSRLLDGTCPFQADLWLQGRIIGDLTETGLEWREEGKARLEVTHRTLEEVANEDRCREVVEESHCPAKIPAQALAKRVLATMGI